jgi:hypothetical protein
MRLLRLFSFITCARPNLETFASTLWDCSTVNAGMGVSKLMRYSFVRHLVFSLLKGRPVIIYGTPQNENVVRVPAPPGLSLPLHVLLLLACSMHIRVA